MNLSAHPIRLAIAATSTLILLAVPASAQNRGVYSAFCPAGAQSASLTKNGVEAPGLHPGLGAQPTMANHTGWPADECLKIDKGPVGSKHTLLGLKDVHNYLLGGYGNDVMIGGNAGDVIWGDYHPEGQPESQTDYIYGGSGENWIYSSHGFNEIWTGTGKDHLALVYGHGVIHCNGKGLKTLVMRYLPQNRYWKLIGCTHKVIDPYRA